MNANPPSAALGRTSRSSMIWGIVTLICGLIVIAMPLVSSIGIVILLAWVILFAGVAHLIFAFHARGVGSVLWQILLGLLYLAAGIYLLINPLLGVVSLTLVLAVFLVLEGIIEIALYFGLRGFQHSGWVLLDGIITLILGILIWRHWPSSSVWVIGTLIGISLIFSGISRIMLSAAAGRAAPAAA